MNHEQYLTEFTKRLRVAEPKRREIIAELKTHLAEPGGTDPFTTLADPKQLARRYNRIHIGLLSHRWLFYLIPLVAVVFLAIEKISGIARLIDRQIFYNESLLGIIIPVILSIFYGRVLLRIFRPARDVVGLIILIWFSSTSLGTYYAELVASLHVTFYPAFAQRLIESAFTTTIMIAISLVVLAIAMLLSHPFNDLKLLSLNIQVIVSGVILLGMVVYLIPMVMVAGVAENVATIVAYPIATAAVAFFFVRRLRQLHHYRKQTLQLQS